MTRKLMAAAVFAVCCGLVTAADEDKKPAEGKGKFGKGGFDKGKQFEKMDANGDGKLTKAEYVDAMKKLTERFKDSGKGGDFAAKLAENAGKRFDEMDKDKKGEITKEQFEKSGPAGGPGGFRGKGKGAPPKKATD